MQTGEIIGRIDVAQLVLYVFWIFFFGLVYYLRREDKREGYPLQSDRSARASRIPVQGFPAMPPPKTFLLAHGASVSAPDPRRADVRPIRAEPTGPWPGAPLEPVGNPMLDGVGPAAYAERADLPDVALDGTPKIIPMRSAPDFAVLDRDPDPRGWDVVGADGAIAGKVSDLWVDCSEPQLRYVEVTVTGAAGAQAVLVPIALARITPRKREVRVQSVHSGHFADAPRTASPDRITLREEDRISAYFASGNLYASPDRLGPLL